MFVQALKISSVRCALDFHTPPRSRPDAVPSAEPRSTRPSPTLQVLTPTNVSLCSVPPPSRPFHDFTCTCTSASCIVCCFPCDLPAFAHALMTHLEYVTIIFPVCNVHLTACVSSCFCLVLCSLVYLLLYIYTLPMYPGQTMLIHHLRTLTYVQTNRVPCCCKRCVSNQSENIKPYLLSAITADAA
jgi:hypothetical protein